MISVFIVELVSTFIELLAPFICVFYILLNTYKKSETSHTLHGLDSILVLAYIRDAALATSSNVNKAPSHTDSIHAQSCPR